MPDTKQQRRSAVRRSLLRTSLAAFALAAAFPTIAADTPLPSGLSAPAKPTAMPAFELPTTAGKRLDSSSLKDQAVVIRFWASW